MRVSGVDVQLRADGLSGLVREVGGVGGRRAA